MSGRAPKQKGNRHEREVVSTFQDMGFAAERQPLSGALGGKYGGDVTFPLFGVDRRIECKHHRDGFKQDYGWLADNYLLVKRCDHGDNLVTLRLSDFLAIAKVAELADSDVDRELSRHLTAGEAA